MTKVYAVTVTGKFQSPIEKFAKMEIKHEAKITDNLNSSENTIKQCAFDLVLSKFATTNYRNTDNWEFEATVREILNVENSIAW